MTDPVFGHRYTVIPDSGDVELHCGTCPDSARWRVGYHPSLDVLIGQARAHDIAEHDNDAGHAAAGALEAETGRLRAVLEVLASPEPMTPTFAEYGDPHAGDELAARMLAAGRALSGGDHHRG
jgi:hypothetical protein